MYIVLFVVDIGWLMNVFVVDECLKKELVILVMGVFGVFILCYGDDFMIVYGDVVCVCCFVFGCSEGVFEYVLWMIDCVIDESVVLSDCDVLFFFVICIILWCMIVVVVIDEVFVMEQMEKMLW